ncbi:NAD-dependent epimerase/dehydratase family protein [Candidatus Pelagibacter sp. HIMB1495]|uniref:NAD-dependent epimerase/dehydratase family protein n=1 Tax=unclassified Candidatus Pelagibacter TaxID=2647897 RepID=UPI003F842B83
MKKKILVVGGTGFIGFHLIKYCVEKKFDVTCISTKPPDQSRKVKKVKYIYSDISNKKNLQKKIKSKYDYVINLGGYVDHSNIKKTYNSHFIGCKNLYSVVKHPKLKLFVQMGSGLEYGKNISPLKESDKCKPSANYGRSKYLATEFLLKKYKEENFPVVIFRLFQAYGPNQSINRIIPITINNCLKGKKFPCTPGNQLRDFIFIDDVVNAICLSFYNKNVIGEIFNIGTNKPKKVKEVVLSIKKIISKGSPQFGKIKMRKDEIKILFPEIKKIKKILNWKPKISLINGLNKTIEYYSKSLN